MFFMIQEWEEHSLCNICGNSDWKNPEKNETLPLVGTIRAFLKIVFSYWKTHDSILACSCPMRQRNSPI